MSRESFRPLAGISCVGCRTLQLLGPIGFRPLAGISCVVFAKKDLTKAGVSVPSRG